MIQTMKPRRLLLFSLLMAGCKTAGMPDKQQALLPERQKLEAVQPQSTETHQNIARAIFPDAPQKAQSADCFSTLTPEMSVQAVVQKCGRRDEESWQWRCLHFRVVRARRFVGLNQHTHTGENW
jgi:hypothetical protein